MGPWTGSNPFPIETQLPSRGQWRGWQGPCLYSHGVFTPFFAPLSDGRLCEALAHAGCRDPLRAVLLGGAGGGLPPETREPRRRRLPGRNGQILLCPSALHQPSDEAAVRVGGLGWAHICVCPRPARVCLCVWPQVSRFGHGPARGSVRVCVFLLCRNLMGFVQESLCLCPGVAGSGARWCGGMFVHKPGVSLHLSVQKSALCGWWCACVFLNTGSYAQMWVFVHDFAWVFSLCGCVSEWGRPGPPRWFIPLAPIRSQIWVCGVIPSSVFSLQRES